LAKTSVELAETSVSCIPVFHRINKCSLETNRCAEKGTKMGSPIVVDVGKVGTFVVGRVPARTDGAAGPGTPGAVDRETCLAASVRNR
jgi:hypothetical protein